VFELIKLAWDTFVIRDAYRKGEMTWKVWLAALGFLAAVYGIGLPAMMLMEKHPEDKRIFPTAATLIGIVLVIYFWLAIRWRLGLRRERLAAEQAATLPK
jgi:cytochrome c biogenesis protein CcdA